MVGFAFCQIILGPSGADPGLVVGGGTNPSPCTSFTDPGALEATVSIFHIPFPYFHIQLVK